MGPSKASMIVKIANEARQLAMQQDKVLKQVAADFKAGHQEILSILGQRGSSR